MISLVGFHVPATFFFERPLEEFLPIGTIFGRRRCHCFINARLHPLQTTHIDMGVFLLEELPDVIRMLRNATLDIHLATVRSFCSRLMA